MKSIKILNGIVVIGIGIVGALDIQSLFSMAIGIGVAMIIIGLVEKESK